jgi:hypothetical protein
MSTEKEAKLKALLTLDTGQNLWKGTVMKMEIKPL